MADKPTDEDDRAVERLTLYMLKETYGAAAAALMRMNPKAADELFQAFERQIAEALDRMHLHRSEGADSTAIAMGVGARIADILDHAHRRQFEARPEAAAPSEDSEIKAARDAGISQDAIEMLASLQSRWPKG